MNSSIPQNNRFDLILCSQEIKKTISSRIQKLNVSLFQLCEQLDYNYEYVRRWMNLTDPTNQNQRMKQWQVIELAQSLGIDIRLTIVVKPEETAYALPYDSKKNRNG